MAKTENEFFSIVVDNIPLIDVRAPVEFAAGSIPNAVNLPLMNDEERHQVGICYKENGQDAAIALGHSLVCGAVKEARINAWKMFVGQNPPALIYCFRGGLRSQLSQSWTEEAIGREVLRIDGGYKAFRTYLMEHLDPDYLKSIPCVLGGRTGSGKTLLLHRLNNVVDLEAIANHRGSSFGSFITPQPTQVDFENRLACALIQCEAKRHRYIILEDEGRNVGRTHIPSPLVTHFANGDVVLLEASMDERVQNTFDEYVISAQQSYMQFFNEDGLNKWNEDIRGSLLRIRKRLGGERLKRVEQLLREAYDEQTDSGETKLHMRWVEVLLAEYYDPMYDYQLEKKQQKIVFRGEAVAVHEYLTNLG